MELAARECPDSMVPQGLKDNQGNAVQMVSMDLRVKKVKMVDLDVLVLVTMQWMW